MSRKITRLLLRLAGERKLPDMALRKLVEETRAHVAEGGVRWAGRTALPKTNVSGAMKAMKLRLKGMGLTHVVRMIEKGDTRGAVKELTRSIADAEREGKDATEYRRMLDLLKEIS